MITISNLSSVLDEDGIIFLAYGGLFTQPLIAGMTEALEKESEGLIKEILGLDYE